MRARSVTAAAVPSPCVFTMNSATPMACDASAPSPLQARATQLDVSPSGTRCFRSFILRFHQWRALPLHLHLPKRVLPDSTIAPPAPVAAAALPRVFINMLATPMACAASAPSPLRARATDTSPLGPRCSCSLNICVHRRVNLLTARTASAFSLPNPCVLRHKAGPPGTGCSRSFNNTSSLRWFTLLPHLQRLDHTSHDKSLPRCPLKLLLYPRHARPLTRRPRRRHVSPRHLHPL